MYLCFNYRGKLFATTGFAIYEVGKQSELFKDTGFLGRIVMTAIRGKVGGFVGSPADLINVRMQNDTKLTLFETGHFTDNIGTHFLASVFVGGMATTTTQQIDVVKTIIMNSKPGEFNSIGVILRHIGKLGPIEFFKGFVSRFIRLGPF
uniref:Mitochondrial dicarboxylate carrier n=1 Tax=Anopheles farauti TaxID=69004 RepID=A0A182QV06_9DIPT